MDTENEKNGWQDNDDVPFGPPPLMYNYKCRVCNFENELNEAHVDVAYGWTKKRTMSSYGKVPILECPNCGKMEYVCIN